MNRQTHVKYNDGKFIKGIIEKYANHKSRKTIYKLIKKATDPDNGWLEWEHAGGKGQMRIIIEDLKANTYKNVHQYKLMVIFDSDRKAKNDSIQHEQQLLINFIKGSPKTLLEEAIYEDSDQIVWHMLYKRETENYIPLDILSKELSLSNELEEDLRSKSVDELDLLDYEKWLEESDIEVKKKFPCLFLKEFTRDQFEGRCAHHKVKIKTPTAHETLEDVSELEQILLKIAKII